MQSSAPRIESPWLTDRTIRPTAPPPRRARWVIVGGGITGTSLAADLADEATVLLDERPALATGASGRNAGFVLAEGAHLFAGPLADALRRIGLATRMRVQALSRTRAFGYAPTGSLRLATCEAEAASFLADVPDVTVLDRSNLPAPWCGGPWWGGRVDAGDAVVDPVALVDALADQAAEGGTHIAAGMRVSSLMPAAGGVAVRCADGTVIQADRVVLATNATTSTLLPKVPIVAQRAQMLEARVQRPSPAWPQPVYARQGADYWRAMPDGRLLLGGCRDAGGTGEETNEAVPSSPVQRALNALLATLLPDTTVRVTRRWAGIMGFTPDGAPLAGPVDDEERVWVLAGFHGHGMGWAPGLAQDVALALREGADRIPPAFRVSRFNGAQ